MEDKLTRSTVTLEKLAKMIDHAILKPQLTDQDVIDGCRLAIRYHVASVSVKPCHLKLAATELQNSDVLLGTVVGFPHGTSSSATKLFEAKDGIKNGAKELDMVMNIGALRSGRYDDVFNEIKAIVEIANGKALVKVILENAYLTKEEIIKACQLAEKAGADFVKTSTGFAPTGATVEDIQLMRATVSQKVQVKAAHGVRSLETVLQMIDAGATRIGATATASILDDFKNKLAKSS
ncbi:MAG: deoxyribose-phosphate aldolase [Anaerolineaceae bacterium]|nr:deoxyribose-phosphate aldolase [Anaerolineaceae bacterium]